MKVNVVLDVFLLAITITVARTQVAAAQAPGPACAPVYVSVLDATTYAEKARITVPDGPGMQIFSPDGKYGYVCSSFTPETVVVSVADHRIVGHVPQASPFCPNIAATPDGTQVWAQ